MLGRRKMPSIGIDIGVSAIKLVEIKRQRENYQVVGAMRTPTPAGAISDGVIQNTGALAKTLAEMVEKAGLAKRRVVTAIGGRKVITRHLKVPLMPVKELSAAVKWEAEKYLPMGNQDLVMDFLNMGEVEADGKKQFSILLAAVSSEIPRAYYNLMAAAGLELAAIDIVPAALARWYTSLNGQKGKQGGGLALVDMGAEASNLVLIDRGKIVFTRVIVGGGNLLTGAIAQSLRINLQDAARFKEEFARLLENNVTKQEESAHGNDFRMIAADMAIREVLGDFIREIRRSLDYYRTQPQATPVTGLIISGGTALLPGLANFLRQELELPVEVGSGLAGAVGTPQLDAGFALATGLALREVTG